MAEEISRIEDDSRVRDLVWRHMGVKSARQIAEETGASPEVILRLKRELLEEVDILNIQEKRQRILVELDGMARDARERAKGMSDEFYAGSINASTSALKALLVELARMEKQDTSKIEQLNQKRVAELVSLMQEVVEGGVREVSDTYGLDEDDLFTIFNRKLISAAEKRDLA